MLALLGYKHKRKEIKMKKIILILAALGFTTSIASAQYATNSYYDDGGNTVHDDGYNTSYSNGGGGEYGTNEYYNGNNGNNYNNGYNNSYNSGTITYNGSASCSNNNSRRRVRWEYSSCGTYKWRIVETGYYAPGRYVNRRGCRRWVAGGWNWRHVSRKKVYTRRGRGYGNNGYYGRR